MKNLTIILQLTFKCLITALAHYARVFPTRLLKLFVRITLQSGNEGRYFMQKIMGTFLTGVLLIFSTVAHAGVVSIPMSRAHQAYLKRDDKTMLRSLIEVLKNESVTQVEKENIRGLLTKSFELNHGTLSSDAKLPNGLTDLAIVTRRGQTKGKVDNIVEVKGTTKSLGLIKTIEFSKYPNHEILNKANSLYEWDESNDGFYLKNKNAGTLEDGLYRLKIVMHDDQVLDVWLPLVDMIANESPKIYQPADEETTLNRNPEIHWQLISPLKPTAYRTKISIQVVFNNPPEYKWDVQWGLYFNDLTRTSAVIGRAADGIGVTALPEGRYQVMVNQNANRNYGPVRVSTQSSQRTTLFVR